jgi:hypothetical protein
MMVETLVDLRVGGIHGQGFTPKAGEVLIPGV